MLSFLQPLAISSGYTSMRPSNRPGHQESLWNALSAAGDLTGRCVFAAEATIALSDLVAGSTLYGRGDELRGLSVLITTTSQLTAASALIELDGIARRIVLCPPDLPLELLPFVIETASVEAIVSDRLTLGMDSSLPVCFVPCSREIVPETCERSAEYETEWILLTSGTTGLPKLVVHTLETLAGAIRRASAPAKPIVWSTFYDIRRYGGLQIFLRSILTGSSLVLSSGEESPAEFLVRAAADGITHISGTPSQWRRALMSPAARLIQPEYVRLSGEVVDQGILNQLKSVYPEARIVHAFASTEAGVAFEVTDGMAGFPASTLEETPGVEMKVVNRSLCIRSERTAHRYLGDKGYVLRDEEGFVDTSDMVELREGRYAFAGRRDGVINVGGLKVYPEEIEAVLNRHPEVQMSLVRTKKNPIMGQLVVADVVLREAALGADSNLIETRDDILLFCRDALASYKVPAMINFVPALVVAESGKLMRGHA
jgi:acyl-coenzyme A synthetase/AMP-(fatty) acid ligase